MNVSALQMLDCVIQANKRRLKCKPGDSSVQTQEFSDLISFAPIQNPLESLACINKPKFR